MWFNKVQNNTPDNVFYDVVVKEEAPFVITHRSSPKAEPVFSGLCIELLKALSEFASFNYNIKLVEHQSYGHQNSHGTWEGLISEIHRGTAQIAAGPIPRAPNEDGNAIVDYTKPYMNTKVNLLIKYPFDQGRPTGMMFDSYGTEMPQEESASDRGIGLMFQPFKAEVWVMLCLAFIAVSLALFLIGRFSPFEWARQPAKDKDCRTNKKMFELKNSFFFAASTISLQGYKEAPRSSAGRLLACMWFMFVLCTLLAYTASLGSILVTRRGVPREAPVFFSGYEDLMDAGRVKLGGVKNTYVYTTLKASKVVGHGLLPKMFSYIDDRHQWITDAKIEGIQRVQDSGGKYALVMETAKAEYIAGSRCDLMAHGESLFRLSYSFAMGKNSPLHERINMGILHFMENGFIHQLQKKYMEAGSCPPRDVTNMASSFSDARQPQPLLAPASSLDMRDMAVPFLFLFLGILASGGVLAGEIYYRKRLAIGKSTQKEASDEKEREPLNTGSKRGRAPRSSPPPNPIVKVNNKLQEEKLSNKMDQPPPPPTKSTLANIEVVIVNEKGRDDAGNNYFDDEKDVNEQQQQQQQQPQQPQPQEQQEQQQQAKGENTEDDVTPKSEGDNPLAKED